MSERRKLQVKLSVVWREGCTLHAAREQPRNIIDPFPHFTFCIFHFRWRMTDDRKDTVDARKDTIEPGGKSKKSDCHPELVSGSFSSLRFKRILPQVKNLLSPFSHFRIVTLANYSPSLNNQ
jgi:hypothetical protein